MHSDTPNAGSARDFRSLTTRLIVWILLAVGGIYAVTVAVSNTLARRIQADMLPKGTAGGADEGYELAATLVPARAVGGDLFNHFRDGQRVFFLVGDVSGKGVPAALFMARTKTLFEAVAAREADPGAILAAANHNLCADNETVRRHRHEEAVALTDGLLVAVRFFAGDAPQSDDITLMTLRFLAPPA